MHYQTLATAALGLLAISPTTAKCLNGPKRAGDVCLPLTRATPSADLAITATLYLKCILAGSRFIWRIDGNRCKPGGCEDCKCRNGRVA
ncbi:hypothetical protein C1H76_8775 [Elsinoe australis]|uniref:Uncharacterized protein n=1 Tax=Elsinoe australis TaxID=40998 RepID=A0A4U7AR52_9PEZI|nr:hypothetical protein C1H76_8775 [Elsinoe australis]